MGTVQEIDYERELREDQKAVRKKILESMRDIKAGRGREYNEFFDELERKYTHA